MRRAITWALLAALVPPTVWWSVQGIHRIRHVVNALLQMGDRLMAKMTEAEEILKTLDDETTRLGTLVTTLTARLATGGLTDEEEARVLERLRSTGERLKLIAHDPANPVPPETGGGAPISEV